LDSRDAFRTHEELNVTKRMVGHSADDSAEPNDRIEANVSYTGVQEHAKRVFA
jgi:hypothetical protein